MMGMSDQDWETKTWKKTPSNPNKQSNAEIQRMIQNGSVHTEKKFSGGGNSAGGDTQGHRALDDSTSAQAPKKISTEFKKALMQARQAKGWTQKELAQKCKEKANVIQQYEAGTIIPQGKMISMLNRKLGITLPKIVKKKVRDE